MKEHFQELNIPQRIALGIGAGVALTAGVVYAVGSERIVDFTKDFFADPCDGKNAPELVQECKTERNNSFNGFTGPYIDW